MTANKESESKLIKWFAIYSIIATFLGAASLGAGVTFICMK